MEIDITLKNLLEQKRLNATTKKKEPKNVNRRRTLTPITTPKSPMGRSKER